MNQASATDVLEFKRGDSFDLTVERVDPNTGNLVNLTGYTIEAQARTADGGLVQTFAVTISNQTLTPGRVKIYATMSDTALWPLRPVFLDIQETSGTYRRSSKTVRIVVAEGITQ